MTRRADVDRLAALLEAERPEVGLAAAAGSPDDLVLASLAASLREVTPEVPPMRAEFRAELRAQVLQAAREQQPSSPLLTRVRDRIQQARYSTGIATGTGLAAMTLSMGGVAGAAELAQPGDLLYGVKLQIEDARLALTFDEVARGQRAVAYAFDRLEEARVAAEAGEDPQAAEALRGAADRMAEGTEVLVTAGQVDPLRSLSEDVARQQSLLDRLLPDLEGEGQMAAQQLAEQLDDTREALSEALLPTGSDPRPDADPDRPAPVVPTPGDPSSTTATPVPEITFPPVGGPTVPPSSGGPSAPSAEDPGLPFPRPTVPGLPNLPAVPSTSGPVVPLDPSVGDILDQGDPTGVVAPATGAVEQVIDGSVLDGSVLDGSVVDGGTAAVGDAVDGVAESVDGVVDGVIGGVAPAPAPLPPAPVAPPPLPSNALPSTSLPSIDAPTGAVPGDPSTAVGDTLGTAGGDVVPQVPGS